MVVQLYNTARFHLANASTLDAFIDVAIYFVLYESCFGVGGVCSPIEMLGNEGLGGDEDDELGREK
ncbi:hypothetical protein DEO72_LG3g663 [Vigna unguiculata]|uniref:Uncharacterized protein n=1 Tax=Vigna unguiculata TaxID=3917 RepID=A0A4D6LC44_VIGUN|nr:hypothetical protein DEO72_LG3g663 [Vigna unguiculata]